MIGQFWPICLSWVDIGAAQLQATSMLNDRESRFLVLVLFLLVLIHFAFSLSTSVPVLYPDEIGYLMNAGTLAGFPTDSSLPYYAGYSLLLWPAFLLGDSPSSVYFIVKVVNTLLFAGTFIALYRLIQGLMPSIDRNQILLAVAVASLYPSLLVFNALALSENAFVFLFVVSAYLLLRLPGSALFQWLVFGACLGLLFMVHPRAVPVLASGFIAAGYLAYVERRYLPFLLALLVAAGLAMLSQPLNVYVQQSLEIGSMGSEHAYAPVANIVEHQFSFDGITRFSVNLVGQSLYLIAATIGAVVFGFFKGFMQVKDGPTETRHVWVFLLLALGGTMLMSAVVLEGRLDHILYGRYNEAVLLPLLVVGLLAATRSVKPWLILVAVVGCLSALLYWYLRENPTPAYGTISIASLYYLFFFFKQLSFFNPFIVFGFFAVIVTVWLLVSRVSSTRFFVIAMAIFLMTSATIGFDLLFLYSGAREIATEKITNHVNKTFEVGTCLNYDDGARDWRKPYIYRYMLYRYPLTRVDIEDRESFCSPWLISDKTDIAAVYPGSILITMEEYDSTGLWRLPEFSDAPDPVDR